MESELDTRIQLMESMKDHYESACVYLKSAIDETAKCVEAVKENLSILSEDNKGHAIQEIEDLGYYERLLELKEAYEEALPMLKKALDECRKGHIVCQMEWRSCKLARNIEQNPDILDEYEEIFETKDEENDET